MILNAYRPYWHPLAPVEEIGEQPRRYDLLGESLVAFRSEAGISVFRDLCVHRGTALSLGRVVDGSLECAYHGWRYDASGKCIRIPSLEPGASIPPKAQLIRYAHREEGGLLWVALEEPKAPFPSYGEECAEGVPGIRHVFVSAYEWSVGAGRVVENFIDVAHFPFVHENTLGTRDQVLVNEHEIEEEEQAIRFTYLQEEPADPSTGVGEIISLQYDIRAPFTVHLKRQTPSGSYSVVSLFVSPTSATTCRLFVNFARNFDLDAASDSRYIEFTDTVMCQDQPVVESVRPEQIPVDLREELHIKVPDAAGVALRRMLGRIEAEGAEA